MKTLRRNPGMLTTLPSIFDELFGDEFSGTRTLGAFRPAVNIAENDNEYGIELRVPGFKKDDFNISIENNELLISAEVGEEKKGETEKYSRREFFKQSFSRTFSLPENAINEEGIKANYVDGVLKIALPKREEAKPKAPKMIAIQ